MLDTIASPPVADPEPPDLGGLRYVRDDGPAIRRRRAGTGFAYLDRSGKAIRNPETLRRIRALAIPPAWADVWICPSANGHIQATGRDARGRKQYRYHASFREMREGEKFERLAAFAAALPAIRAAVADHMSLRGLPRAKVLATVVHLLETTLIRVGNDEYAKANKSYGLTTLTNRHVSVAGAEIRFHFVGKSGKQWSLAMRDRRVAKILRACQELPGQHLLQYFDDVRELRAVSSADVNAYLREASGAEITAKDFRTWAGTLLMTRFLGEAGPFESKAQAKTLVRGALMRVASALGNTPTVCRKSYIHPAVPEAWVAGTLALELGSKTQGLSEEESALLLFLTKAA